MKTRCLLDQHQSFEALVQHINQHPVWRRCQLAGRYAYEQASADYSSDDELGDVYFREDGGDSTFTSHLSVLAKHDCRFTRCVALEWAKGYADLPFDLGT